MVTQMGSHERSRSTAPLGSSCSPKRKDNSSAAASSMVTKWPFDYGILFEWTGSLIAFVLTVFPLRLTVMVTISYLDDDLMLFMVKSSSCRSLELEFLKSVHFKFLVLPLQRLIRQVGPGAWMGKSMLPSFTSKAGMAMLQPLHSTDLLSPDIWMFPLTSAELLMIYTLKWEMGQRTSSCQPERNDGCLTGRTGEQRLRWFIQGRTQLRVGRRDDMVLWGKNIICEWWQRCETLCCFHLY